MSRPQVMKVKMLKTVYMEDKGLPKQTAPEIQKINDPKMPFLHGKVIFPLGAIAYFNENQVKHLNKEYRAVKEL
jgi:hypothetical protein